MLLKSNGIGSMIVSAIAFAYGIVGSFGGRADVGDEFEAAAAYVNQNGGLVHSGLKANLTSHGGATIRGVVTKRPVLRDDLLIRVPRSLWILLENFPEFASVELPPSCNGTTPVDPDTIKLVGALAAESALGNRSSRYEYLRTLPHLDGFKMFHPRYVEGSVRHDFAALPIVPQAVGLQQIDTALKVCFEDWRHAPRSLVADISWNHMEAAYAQFRTRRVGIDGSIGAMIPAMDMFNTDRSTHVNTKWHVSKDAFTQRVGASTLYTGIELSDNYCSTCDNHLMLIIWGVYMEDNPNELVEEVDCSANAGTASSLREASQSVLDLSYEGRALATANGWKAPRCRSGEAVTHRGVAQGPLRCSLARLAWEYCAGFWEHGLHRPSTKLVPWGRTSKAISKSKAVSLAATEGRIVRRRSGTSLAEIENSAIEVPRDTHRVSLLHTRRL